MSNEGRAFFSLPRYPAYICLLEVCWLLGLKLHQGKILVARGLIKPAGKRRNRKGWPFITAHILELADDRDWLDKAKDALSWHWEGFRARKKSKIHRTAQVAQFSGLCLANRRCSLWQIPCLPAGCSSPAPSIAAPGSLGHAARL